MENDDVVWLSLQEAVEMFQYTAAHIRRLCRDGSIAFKRLDRKTLLIDKQSLSVYCEFAGAGGRKPG